LCVSGCVCLCEWVCGVCVCGFVCVCVCGCVCVVCVCAGVCVRGWVGAWEFVRVSMGMPFPEMTLSFRQDDGGVPPLCVHHPIYEHIK